MLQRGVWKHRMPAIRARLVLGKFNRITGNWYKTGDAGYISKEGHLFVTGRITEVIAVDETMVLPCYIEGVFARHPRCSFHDSRRKFI